METRLKERLVGAIVLVLAAVVFIPMLLDGPGRNRSVTQPVALPGADRQDLRTVTIDLDRRGVENRTTVHPSRDRSAQEPASIDLVPDQESREVADNPAVEQPRIPAATTPSTPNRSNAVQQPSQPASETKVTSRQTSEPWTVQVGSFSRSANADALVEKLRGIGYTAYVSEFTDGNGKHFRVRAGGFPTREAAQVKADEIRNRTGEPARATPAD